MVWGAGLEGEAAEARESTCAACSLFPATGDDGRWLPTAAERCDLRHVDVAPLLAALLAVPPPSNSAGVLPLGYLRGWEVEPRARAMAANAEQLASAAFHHESQLRYTRLFFRPARIVSPSLASLQEACDEAQAAGDWDKLEHSACALARRSLEALAYYERYDALLLRVGMVLAYLGWILVLLRYAIEGDAEVVGGVEVRCGRAARKHAGVRGGVMALGGFAVLAAWLLLNRMPAGHCCYFALAAIVWAVVLRDVEAFGLPRLLEDALGLRGRVAAGRSPRAKLSRAALSGGDIALGERSVVLLLPLLAALCSVEALLWALRSRRVCALCIALATLAAEVAAHRQEQQVDLRSLARASALMALVACALRSERADETEMPTRVACGGLIVAAAAIAASMLFGRPLQVNPTPGFQVAALGSAGALAWVTTRARHAEHSAHSPAQSLNWALSGFALALPVLGRGALAGVEQLLSVGLGIAPMVVLLSLADEAAAFAALLVATFAWVDAEGAAALALALTVGATGAGPPHAMRANGDNQASLGTAASSQPQLSLALEQVRIAATYLCLLLAAHYGAGHVTSSLSYEIASVYRFSTRPRPLLMESLLVAKVLLPPLLATVALGVVLGIRRQRCRLGSSQVLATVSLLCNAMAMRAAWRVARWAGDEAALEEALVHFVVSNVVAGALWPMFWLGECYSRSVLVRSVRIKNA